MHHRQSPRVTRAFTPPPAWTAFPPHGAGALHVTRILWSHGNATGTPGQAR